jgi:hypothetical protein
VPFQAHRQSLRIVALRWGATSADDLCFDSGGRALMRHIFISYATSDRKEALAVCEAIERRGPRCWIACRDVQPGENYQEAIVRAIRNARALVLVFSDHANNSDEIKKELSLVSRYRVPLMALRIEDVEPSDAFAYELATRQWIDLFEDWDKSLDALVRRVDDISSPEDGEQAAPPAAAASEPRAATARAVPPPASTAPPPARPARFGTATLAIAAVVLLAVIAAAAGWFMLRPAARAEHPMEVRLTGFQRLSPDIPEGMPEAIRDEIISTFQDDGLIGISTAKAPRPGDAPAYSLGGTIRREGDKTRVIVTVANERTGTTLWSETFPYGADEVAHLPRVFALTVGNIVRTSLFAASTYPKALPDPVLADYFAGTALAFNDGSPTKGLDLARRIVAAAPDFSWGWSNLQGAAMYASTIPGSADAKALVEEAKRAGDTAIQLDPSNSEALTTKAFMIDPGDQAAREALFKRALQARPLACGCEHHMYGIFLAEVGRTGDAIKELRRSVDVMPLNPSSQLVLGAFLSATGDVEEGQEHYDKYQEIAYRPGSASRLAITKAVVAHKFADAIPPLDDPALHLPPAVKAAWVAALRALAGKDPAARAAAGPAVMAQIDNGDMQLGMMLLGNLGDYADAFRVVRGRGTTYDVYFRSLLFAPGMEGAVHDPAIPALVEQLGLVKYWRDTKTRPDFCGKLDAPALCKAI